MATVAYTSEQIDFALTYLAGNGLGLVIGGFVAAQTTFQLFFSQHPVRKGYFRVILACLVLLTGFLACLLTGERSPAESGRRRLTLPTDTLLTYGKGFGDIEVVYGYTKAYCVSQVRSDDGDDDESSSRVADDRRVGRCARARHLRLSSLCPSRLPHLVGGLSQRPLPGNGDLLVR